MLSTNDCNKPEIRVTGHSSQKGRLEQAKSHETLEVLPRDSRLHRRWKEGDGCLVQDEEVK